MSGDWKDQVAYAVVALIIAATFVAVLHESGGGYRNIPSDSPAQGCTRRPCN